MTSVGVVGGSGYMGGEALRVLLKHPRAEIAWTTSRTPGPVDNVHANLYGAGLHFDRIEDVKTPDFVLLALPTALSIEVAGRFAEAGARVIDLGSAFRLRDRTVWERLYGQKHSKWKLAEEAVYGIPELHAGQIEKARVVANPGCFSSAAILAMAPLIKAGIVDPLKITVQGLSGTAGAGADLSRAIHHPEIGANVVLYNVVGHRHTFEMEQELGGLAEGTVRVHFTPCYIPIVRGIVDICRCFPLEEVSRATVLDLYRNFYEEAPFVKVFDRPSDRNEAWNFKPYPAVSAVAGTNYCHLGLEVDEERNSLVVMSVLDSIGKGGAQVAIENLNIMAGFNRTDGLTDYGFHP